MRPISIQAISTFFTLLLFIIVLATSVTWLGFSLLDLGAFNGVIYSLLFMIALYAITLLFYRTFLNFFPLKEGVIEEGTREEFGYHVYLLFYLLLFYSLTRSKVIPVPLMRQIYLWLGATFGENTFCSGTILDPPLIVVGNNTLLGQDCVIYSHAIEGRNLSHALINIGDNVTVGANSVIMSGVIIEDDAIVAAGAVVTKGTKIGKREVWGGVPAKKIKTLLDNT